MECEYMNSVFTILLTIVILGSLGGIVYIITYNNLQSNKIKINESESIIDDLLRKKYDTLNLIKDVIIDETKLPDKTFNEYKKLKEINISSFDFERKLTEYNSLINKIKNDYDILDNDTRFINYYNDIYDINEKLEAAKSFYNKYTSKLNGLIKKFPSNMIAKIHNIESRLYFDNKNMQDDDILDFKL